MAGEQCLGINTMSKFSTTVLATIFGTKNAWSLEPDAPSVPRTETAVDLEIQGSPKDGYHLVMSPEGFFAADNWYATLEEAFADGLSLFSVSREVWRES